MNIFVSIMNLVDDCLTTDAYNVRYSTCTIYIYNKAGTV
jgi:hypothetical protein